jgi:hypothetical protein
MLGVAGDVLVELSDEARDVGPRTARDAVIGLGVAFSVHLSVSLIVGIQSLYWTLDKNLKWHYCVYCIAQCYAFTFFNAIYNIHAGWQWHVAPVEVCVLGASSQICLLFLLGAVAFYRRDVFSKQMGIDHGPAAAVTCDMVVKNYV